MSFANKLSINVTANIILAMLLCVLIFHALVLVGLMPYSIVWGGRLESISQMYVFEAASLTLNLVIMPVVAMKVAYIPPFISGKIINIILWLLVGLFLLNTLGNAISLSTLEAIIFTPLTLISALLFYRMAIER